MEKNVDEAKYNDNLEQRMATRKQESASVAVWAAVTADGDSGVNINQEVYCQKLLSCALMPRAHKHFGTSSRRWTLQQDSAPSHKAR